MYCANCQTETTATGGHCGRCGTPLNSRLCSNGHIMDASWSECRYCSGASATAAGSLGAKGRTLVESGPANGFGAAGGSAKGGTLIESGGGAPGGGFVRGATLLEGVAGGRPLAAGKGATVHESLLPKGQTVVEGPSGGRGKARTVFDPGSSGTSASPARNVPRLVGWLVSFTHVSSGEDFRLREGRNVLGADATECDVAVTGDPSVSSKHAVIVCREGQLQIRDNDSTNGTYVNGDDVFGKGGVPLRNLDRVRLGSMEFVLYTLGQSQEE
jgi:hypothetical protein